MTPNEVKTALLLLGFMEEPGTSHTWRMRTKGKRDYAPTTKAIVYSEEENHYHMLWFGEGDKYLNISNPIKLMKLVGESMNEKV
jgi:hypothetical protein